MNSDNSRMTPLLEVENLRVTYVLPSQKIFGLARRFDAVDNVSFSIGQGESFGLVGETGCGKSSLSRAICGLAPVSSGSVRFNGSNLNSASRTERRVIRKDIQMIFQDPGGSLNPRMRIARLIAEPLTIHGVGNRKTRREKVLQILEAVGLSAVDANRLPHELSGGQRQRIAIARAVAVEPALILADEPVSALDVSLQAQILNLIAKLRRELGLALLFVSHDLNVVRYLCSIVAVMYLGQIVEYGPTRKVLDAPGHPYTKELVDSSPVPDPQQPIRLIASSGEPPNPSAPPTGCRYHPRCPIATDICVTQKPEFRAIENIRQVACHHAEYFYKK